jgi:hypothetical protein
MSQFKREYAEWLTADLFRFCQETGIVPDIEEQPHREMCNEIMAYEQVPHLPQYREQIKGSFLAPRYTYKSSIIEADICRNILKDDDLAIGLFRANRELSAAMMRDVKMHLTSNDVILDTWGDISEGSEKWSEFEIISNRRRRPQASPTLYAASIGVSTTGMHFTRGYMDDLVVRENCDSVKEMQDARVLVQSMNPVIGPWGRLIITGTRWSSIDVYGWIKERNRKLIEKGKKPSFREYSRSAYTIDPVTGETQLFFPQVLSEQFLEDERQELEPRYYAAWYLNQTHEEGLKAFTTLQFFDGEFEQTPVPVVKLDDGEVIPVVPVVLVDPALTASGSSDSFGINVVCFDGASPKPNWWVMQSLEIRQLPSEAGLVIISLLLEYDPELCVIESANADAEMVSRIQEAIGQHNLRTRIMGYSALQDESKGKRGKRQRIEALEPICRQHRMWLRRTKTLPLSRQMDMYSGVLEHDDVLDSLAMGRKAEQLVHVRTQEQMREELGLEKPDPWREALRRKEEGLHSGVLKGTHTGYSSQRLPL